VASRGQLVTRDEQVMDGERASPTRQRWTVFDPANPKGVVVVVVRGAERKLNGD
jgi:hypothetical protein